MKLELFYFSACPYCQRVLSYLDSVGAEKDKVTLIDTSADPEARARHIDTTGRATVPCLYIDGEPLFESNDIVAWLAKHLKDS